MTVDEMIRGDRYRVTTATGMASGRFLGVEVPYGDWSLLIESEGTTRSVAIDRVLAVVGLPD